MTWSIFSVSLKVLKILRLRCDTYCNPIRLNAMAIIISFATHFNTKALRWKQQFCLAQAYIYLAVYISIAIDRFECRLTIAKTAYRLIAKTSPWIMLGKLPKRTGSLVQIGCEVTPLDRGVKGNCKFLSEICAFGKIERRTGPLGSVPQWHFF